MREVDEFSAMQTLYLLDRFGVSDEFYHELTQVNPSFQRSYVVKLIRKKLNSEVDMIRIVNGAYRPFKSTLSSFLSHIIWQNREPTGKPIPGSFDWTPLSGKHKLQVLKNLPVKMDTIFEESIAPSVAKLWNDFLKSLLYASPNPTQVTTFHDKAKEWVKHFLSLGKKLQGHQRKHITPYMHCMVYHVPTMLRKYGNLRQFSGQGVEKNNDDSKRHYFSSNKHDAPGEIIRSECRQEALQRGVWGHPTCVRQKRGYNKVDSDYWDQGGIQAVRKCSRGDPT